MTGIIKETFGEWTRGNDPLAARISVFEHIRDIPYAIVAELRDPVYGPEGLLKLRRGSCGPKHILLAAMFKELGIPVKLVTLKFNWDDPAIKFSPELRTLTRQIPLGGHLACRALINDKWVLVDATWDVPLKKAGYTVNESWDGLSGLKSAVTVINETVHESLEDRLAYDAAIKSSHTAADKDNYDKFIQKLNPWLAKFR